MDGRYSQCRVLFFQCRMQPWETVICTCTTMLQTRRLKSPLDSSRILSCTKGYASYLDLLLQGLTRRPVALRNQLVCVDYRLTASL
ncbi:hypothetical protein M404DRAFT_403734 [Pisolithus tinctorius Marx 270]|uniref:Uncharacterized protein n=1 Tax=Pisolithus tinctorius Marx 270 TaxID=870435 RepID=A0A0C3NEM5_PISTI|nr:hypothetical protein M404DRAFT_403734 [Pisolithus tinctorius Marx 270]